MSLRIAILIMLFILSCNDGELGISAIDFSDVEVDSCEDDITATVFFKTKGKEALILEIPRDLLANEASENPIQAQIPSQVKLIYRVFVDNVNKGYFCNPLPTINPVVTSTEASGGLLTIVTEAETDEQGQIVSYKHTFRILNLLLSAVNNQGSVASDDFFYGTFTTHPLKDI